MKPTSFSSINVAGLHRPQLDHCPTMALPSPASRQPHPPSIQRRNTLLLRHPLRESVQRRLTLKHQGSGRLDLHGTEQLCSQDELKVRYNTPPTAAKKVVSCVHLSKFLNSTSVEGAIAAEPLLIPTRPPVAPPSVRKPSGPAIPKVHESKVSTQSEGMVRAYAANSHQGLARYISP